MGKREIKTRYSASRKELLDFAEEYKSKRITMHFYTHISTDVDDDYHTYNGSDKDYNDLIETINNGDVLQLWLED